MFNSITGRLTLHKEEGRIFLQSGQVEWDIFTSRTSIEDLSGGEEGRRVRIFVHLYHRDDQLKLYGFSKRAERDLFLDLIRVEGVGPRQALKILSGIQVHHFVEALEAEDLSTLASLPGLGEKTAQKILLKLKGKLSISPPDQLSYEDELTEALAGMGFDRKVARSAIRSSLRELKDRSMPKEEQERELLKNAIALISTGESRS